MATIEDIRLHGVPHDAHISDWLRQDPDRLAAWQVEQGFRRHDYEDSRAGLSGELTGVKGANVPPPRR